MSEKVPCVEGRDAYDPFGGADRNEIRSRHIHYLVQTIIGEIDYVGTARDDEVWWQLHAIEDANGMPLDITADEAYNLYHSNYGGDQ